MLGDTVSIRAYGWFKNSATTYLLQKYISNHFIWNNSFGKTRSFRVGGELVIPWTKTKLRAGVENLQNYVYFDESSKPAQYGGNVQVFSATLDQKLRFGIDHIPDFVQFRRDTAPGLERLQQHVPAFPGFPSA